MIFYYRQRHHPGVQGTGSAVPEVDTLVGSEQSGKAVRFALLLALSAILVLTAAPTVMTEGSHATGTEQDVPSGETDGGEQTDTSTGDGDGEQSGSEVSDSSTVEFSIEPSSATITVEGGGQTYTFKNKESKELPLGDYTYIVTADGYESETGHFSLNSIVGVYITISMSVDESMSTRFTENTIHVYTRCFELPFIASDGEEPTFKFDSDDVVYNQKTNIVTLPDNILTLSVKMYVNGNYVDILNVIIDSTNDIGEDSGILISWTEAADKEGSERKNEIKYYDTEFEYEVYFDISSVEDNTEPVRINITEMLIQAGSLGDIAFGYGHDEYEVLAVHFGENTVDYPEVEIIDGQVYITVSEFSTYGFYIYLAQEHTAFDPVYPPWSEDDDYVPFPPIVVEESEDNSVEVVACAAAAVVAALMAAFLIIDRRKG